MKSQFIMISKYFKKMYEHFSQPILAEFNLTQLEMDVLAFIANNPQHNRASDIVEERLISKSNVSKAIDSLSKRGLIKVVNDQSDKRIYKLYINDVAMELVEKIRIMQKQFQNVLIEGFDENELMMLEKAINRILNNISKELGRE